MCCVSFVTSAARLPLLSLGPALYAVRNGRGCTLAASDQELASTKHWCVVRITDGVYVCIMSRTRGTVDTQLGQSR